MRRLRFAVMQSSRAVAIAAILSAANTPLQAQDLDKGRTEFLSKCAECHGADGKGAGPTSSKLKRKPADLTALAKNNNGVFSAGAIAAIVDGRSAVPHRGLESNRYELPRPGDQRARG